MDNNALLSELIYRTHAVSDRRQKEWHISCPECGAESSPKHPHFSFSAKGAHCFVCGASMSLKKLAEALQMDTTSLTAPRPAPQPKPRKPPSWMATPEVFVRRYEAHPKRFELWNAYKPLPVEVIEARHLGVGVLPEYSSHCQHERLIVPVYAGTRIVGLRGRQLACDCGKWLAAGGTTLDMLPLYNAEAIPRGAVVMIVENPVDALLICARTPYHGVATYSVTYWRDEWTALLRAAQPELVITAYDNDLAGNGGAKRRQQLIREWRQKHPDLDPEKYPQARGPALTNALLAAGLPAVLYDWGAETVKDIGAKLAAQEAQNCF